MYSIVTTQKFDSHYQSILDYIAFELYNPRAALNITEELNDIMKRLSVLPNTYAVYKDTHLFSGIEYRYISIGNYLIFYSIDEDNERVVLEDMVYGKRLL